MASKWEDLGGQIAVQAAHLDAATHQLLTDLRTFHQSGQWAARRLACDCGAVYATEDAAGRTLSIGRKTRSIPASLKRALLLRDRHCRFPGCTNRLFVEGHHIEHWADGGETSLRNIVGLCGHHHRFVHEYGYRIELDDAHEPRFFDPRGRPVREVPERPLQPDLGWPAIHARNAQLGITEWTNECLGDGNPVQWPRVIDALVYLDGIRWSS